MAFTITVDQDVSVLDINFTGADALAATFSMDSATIDCYGNFTAISAMTVTPGTATLKMNGASKTFAGCGKTYFNIEFIGSTTVTGDNVFSGFTGHADSTITLTAGSVQTCSTILGDGTSGHLVTLLSSSAGNYATISCASGTYLRQYWSIKDNHATGGASFYAFYSTDVSGNSGWDFSNPSTVRYWVGDTGDWSSTLHWSFLHSGPAGAPVPTSADDVVFDSTSFTTTGRVVTLDADGSCKSMDWNGATNTPAFVASSKTLSIYGTVFRLISGMTQSGIAYNFVGTGSCAITTAGHYPDNVIINGTGTFTLQDALTVDNALTLTKGTLDTNGKAVTSDLTSTGNETRVLTLGATVWDCWVSWTISGTNMTLNANTSAIKMHASSVGFYGAGKTYYNVEILGDSVTIYGDNTFNDLKLTKNTNTEFTAGSTQTFVSLSGDGESGQHVAISSTEFFTPYSFVSTGADITRDHWSIMDCHASGAVFKATNSTDWTGNTGWLFVSVNRYWIADDGDWSDTDHWAYQSGGAAGAEVPTSAEDVYFDANSFSTESVVNIDFSAECRNFDSSGVTSTPTINDGSVLGIQVYGSLTLGILNFSTGAGIFHMYATETGKTVTTAGNHLQQLDFYGTGGGWSFQDSVHVVYLALIEGVLDTNGQTVYCESFSSTGVAVRSLTLGASEMTVFGDLELSASANLTITPGTSKVIMSKDSSDFYGYGKAFYDLQITGDGVVIHGDNSFNDIELTAPNTTQFQSGSQQTLVSLSGSGSFGSLITIEATTPGSYFSLGKVTGTVAVSYWSIKDSHAVTSGGAVFNALDHCVDAGGNAGWNFPVAGEFTVYVGDTQVSKAYVGDTEVSRIYIGSTQI